MTKLNYDYLFHMIRKRSGYTVIDYCTHKLHRCEAYLSGCKRRGKEPNKDDLDFMVKDLGLDRNALWQIDEPVEENDPNEMTAEEFNKLFTEKATIIGYPTQFTEDTEDIEEDVEDIEKESFDAVALRLDLVSLMDAIEEVNTKLDMILEMEGHIVKTENAVNRVEEALNRIEATMAKPRESTLDRVLKALTTEVQNV